MNLPRKLKRLFEALSIIGLILVIALIFSIQMWMNPPAIMATATQSITFTPSPYATFTAPSAIASIPVLISPLPPYDYPTAMPPTATPMVAMGKEPPPCTFPLAQTTTEESSPENYTFSEPRVMITDENAAFDIVQWLPDSQRALIVREIIKKGIEQYQSIELFNPRTVKVQVYAKPKSSISPSWIPGLDGVIYSEFLAEHSSWDANGKYIPPSTDIAHMLLWFSNGDPDKAQKIEDVQYHLSSVPHEWVLSSLAAKPDGSQIVYLKTNGNHLFQLYDRDVSQGSLGIEQLIPFDASQWSNVMNPDRYEMVWHPNTTQILFNADSSYAGRMDSFLFDINTGSTCKLDFGSVPGESKHAWVARWSPNGRYLAIVRGWYYFPSDFSNLDVLDTLTGKQYTLAFSPDVQGRHYVMDIAWAPDNYHLAAIGEVNSFEHCAYSDTCIEPVDRLYSVDFISGKADLLFPSFQFDETNLAWSPDGSKLLATSWDGSESRLCLIPIQKADQP